MVYHYAQRARKRARNTSFTDSGLVPCGSTPPFSFLGVLLYRMLKILRSFKLFRLLRLFGMPPTNTHSSTFLSPNLHRPTLVACYAPFDPPEPLFTSVLCGRCCLISLSPNLGFGEEILALRSSRRNSAQRRNIATPQHLLAPPPTPLTSWRFQWMVGYGMRYAL